MPDMRHSTVLTSILSLYVYIVIVVIVVVFLIPPARPTDWANVQHGRDDVSVTSDTHCSHHAWLACPSVREQASERRREGVARTAATAHDEGQGAKDGRGSQRRTEGEGRIKAH